MAKGKDQKPVAAVAATPRKSSRNAEKVVKRKATEDVSPASAKKRKAVLAEKPAVTKAAESTKPKKPLADTKKEAKPAKKSTKKQKAADVVVSEDKENDTERQGNVAVEDDASTKALVQEIDGGADGDESADDEAPGGASLFKPGQDVGKAPAAAVKKAAQIKSAKSTKKVAASADGTVAKAAPGQGDEEQELGGVVYVGRVPHGFFEHEMRSYFSQFGDIRRLRLSRNRKTGASKHYAFIEFVDREVADIVAKTMDNYLLFGHLLRCSVVSPERIPPNLFKGANRRFKTVPWNHMAGRQLAQPKPETAWVQKISREEKRRADRAAQLESKLGYSFAGPTLKSVDTAIADAPAPAVEDKKEGEPEQKLIEPAATEEDVTTTAVPVVPELVAAPAKGKKGKGKKNKA